MTEKKEWLSLGNQQLAGINCTIQYKKEFRWSWLATQMNTFVFIGEATGPINRQTIEAFSTACFKYALKNNRGWPRGLQAAVGSIAILKGSTIESSAVEFCERVAKKHWSAFELAVLQETSSGKVIRYQSAPVWGRIYYPYFSKIIDRIAGNI